MDEHQTMLVNENRLNLADQRARQYLARQMEIFSSAQGSSSPRVCAAASKTGTKYACLSVSNIHAGFP